MYSSLGRRKEQSIAELSEIRLSANDAKKNKSATLTRDKNGNSPVNKPLRSPVSASLDRKYLRFLRVAPEKQPIPTPQFRSYRRPSPTSSPTALVHPEPSLSPSYWQDDLKPPPRPPSECKPTSPLLLQPPPTREKTPQRTVPVVPERNRTSPLAEPTVRKSVSASRLLGSNRNLRSASRRTDSTISEESVPRRHSVEISETKRQSLKSPVKTPDELPKSPTEKTDRRLLYGSLNRGTKTLVGSSEIYEGRSGYAKIKPRKLSNVADYSRSSKDNISVVSQESLVHSPTKSSPFFSSPLKSPLTPTSPGHGDLSRYHSLSDSSFEGTHCVF